jgi:hypothetical protein
MSCRLGFAFDVLQRSGAAVRIVQLPISEECALSSEIGRPYILAGELVTGAGGVGSSLQYGSGLEHSSAMQFFRASVRHIGYVPASCGGCEHIPCAVGGSSDRTCTLPNFKSEHSHHFDLKLISSHKALRLNMTRGLEYCM